VLVVIFGDRRGGEMADAIVGPLLTKLKDVALTEAQALARVGGEI